QTSILQLIGVYAYSQGTQGIVVTAPETMLHLEQTDATKEANVKLIAHELGRFILSALIGIPGDPTQMSCVTAFADTVFNEEITRPILSMKAPDARAYVEELLMDMPEAAV